MLELFLQLLEKLGQQKELRETKRRRLLDDYARPILKKMEEIHNDYRNSVATARKLLKDGASPVDVLETIQKDKWDLQPVRDRVIASETAILERESQLDETGQRFFFSLEQYFRTLGSSSVYAYVIRELATERPSDHLMGLVVSWLETQWREISDTFAKFEASVA